MRLNYNKVILAGTVSKVYGEPKKLEKSGDTSLRFSVVVNGWNPITQLQTTDGFFLVEYYAKSTTNMPFIVKGANVAIYDGKLKQQKYTDKNGEEKISSTHITTRTVFLIDVKNGKFNKSEGYNQQGAVGGRDDTWADDKGSQPFNSWGTNPKPAEQKPAENEEHNNEPEGDPEAPEGWG